MRGCLLTFRWGDVEFVEAVGEDVVVENLDYVVIVG